MKSADNPQPLLDMAYVQVLDDPRIPPFEKLLLVKMTTQIDRAWHYKDLANWCRVQSTGMVLDALRELRRLGYVQPAGFDNGYSGARSYRVVRP